MQYKYGKISNPDVSALFTVCAPGKQVKMALRRQMKDRNSTNRRFSDFISNFSIKGCCHSSEWGYC
jgi:hypothetical protein